MSSASCTELAISQPTGTVLVGNGAAAARASFHAIPDATTPAPPQGVVRPQRVGEAFGVLLTTVVTAGGAGVAAAARTITTLQPSGASTYTAINGNPRVIALLVIATVVIVIVIRHQLVRRGLMASLSTNARWPPAGERHGRGRSENLAHTERRDPDHDQQRPRSIELPQRIRLARVGDRQVCERER